MIARTALLILSLLVPGVLMTASSPAPPSPSADRLPDPPWSGRWEWADRPGFESLTVSRDGEEIVATSDVLVVLDEIPTHVTYRLVYDRDWHFRRAHIGSVDGGTERELDIAWTGGGWRVNGTVRPDLSGCTDLDIMVTPFTNTPPLWRLNPSAAGDDRTEGVGEARPLQVAWVHFPDLAVSAVRQEYRRLPDAGPWRRYLYRNLESGFEGELTVDRHRLVVDYGPWRRVAPVRSPADPPS